MARFGTRTDEDIQQDLLNNMSEYRTKKTKYSGKRKPMTLYFFLEISYGSRTVTSSCVSLGATYGLRAECSFSLRLK